MSMMRIVARLAAFTATFCAVVVSGQQKPAVSGALEFPVTMRQNVEAGKTPVGTKVEANLMVATLVAGHVVPIGATFSGQVVESVVKSATNPSRLSVRMDSVRWKKGSAAIKVYLTAWYYPIQMETNDDDTYETVDSLVRRRHANGPPNVPPGPKGPDVLPPPPPRISNRRVLMKDVETVRDRNVDIALASSHFNIKLDKTTTYVLATGGLTNGK